MNTGEIIIYQSKDGQTAIDVRLEEETVWLTLDQMAELFERDKSVISRHIKKVFQEKELVYNSVVAKNAITATDNKVYLVDFYNLDVIISVGYRVKSKRGTQFRIWANSVLKNYLLKGYAVNEKATREQLNNLSAMVALLSDAMETKAISADEAQGLLKIVKDYAYGLDTLDRYDHQQLTINETTKGKEFKITYANATKALKSLKSKFGTSEIFAREKDDSFKSSLNTIYQTFDGKELYPSIEEKAAMLLYLVVKNHSFTDGNKRIAAFLFLIFLQKNKLLYKTNGQKLIENNTLVALTLMIAQSNPDEKDTMVKIIVNLINKNN